MTFQPPRRTVIHVPESPATLLVVDDEPAVRRLLRACFETERYRVLEAADGASMFDVLAREPVDIVTLDVGLGSENGLDLARRLRADSDVGLIMVSGKGETIDTVLGLEIGADDYIAKPFELRIVLARVRSLLRRVRERAEASAPIARATIHPAHPAREHRAHATNGSPAHAAECEPRYRFGGCTLFPLRRELVCGDPPAAGERLTGAEHDLLEAFVTNAQQVLSRDQLMDRLKGRDWIPSDRTIDNQVVRLRRKLAAHGLRDVIRTVRGAGYLFSTPVERLGEPRR